MLDAPGPVEVWGADAPTPDVWPDGTDVLHVSRLRTDHDRLTAGGARSVAEPADGGPAAPESVPGTIIVVLPRNRAQGQGWIARALAQLPEGGLLVVDGPKDNGVDSTLKALRKLLPTEGVIPKAHGKIAWARAPKTADSAFDDWRTRAGLQPNADGYITAAGVFSADALDPGSADLIAALPQGLKGHAADLGAGWGPVAAATLALNPELDALDLIEADGIALEAARRNIADPRAQYHWADATRWTGEPDGRGYDLIVSNPPFHTSRTAEPSLGQAFISAAARLLRPKGRFVMVANRQLPYEKAMQAAFHSWSEIGGGRLYKVLSAHHPRKKP